MGLSWRRETKSCAKGYVVWVRELIADVAVKKTDDMI